MGLYSVFIALFSLSVKIRSVWSVDFPPSKAFLRAVAKIDVGGYMGREIKRITFPTEPTEQLR